MINETPSCRRRWLLAAAMVTCFAFTAAEPSSTTWPYTNSLEAIYDGVRASSVQLTLSSVLTAPGNLVKQIGTLFNHNLMRYNDSVSDDGEKDNEESIRLHIFSLVRAHGAEHELNWVGAAMNSDGASFWVYPRNKTEYGYKPTHRGNASSGLVYEANIGGAASRCGASVTYCLKDWWLSPGGEALLPLVGDWGHYDPRRRPWFRQVMDEELRPDEAFWASALTTWCKFVRCTITLVLLRK